MLRGIVGELLEEAFRPFRRRKFRWRPDEHGPARELVQLRLQGFDGVKIVLSDIERIWDGSEIRFGKANCQRTLRVSIQKAVHVLRNIRAHTKFLDAAYFGLVGEPPHASSQ